MKHLIAVSLLRGGKNSREWWTRRVSDSSTIAWGGSTKASEISGRDSIVCSIRESSSGNIKYGPPPGASCHNSCLVVCWRIMDWIQWNYPIEEKYNGIVFRHGDVDETMKTMKSRCAHRWWFENGSSLDSFNSECVNIQIEIVSCHSWWSFAGVELRARGNEDEGWFHIYLKDIPLVRLIFHYLHDGW